MTKVNTKDTELTNLLCGPEERKTSTRVASRNLIEEGDHL